MGRACGAACIRLARNRIAYATACLVSTDAVRKIIIEGSQLICAVIAHPCATRARGHGKLDAVILRNNADLGVVFVRCADRTYSGEEKRKR